MLTLDPSTTALVLIDLQQGILPFAQANPASQVLSNANALAKRFHELNAPVVWVRVGWSSDGGDMLKLQVDQAPPSPPGGMPANWLSFPPELEVADSDIKITKRQWGAFYGTELDLQLRRRGIKCILLGGIATNIGVESTARAAWEHGYEQVIVEDATSAPKLEHHQFSMANIMPRLGRVRSTAEVLAALSR